MKCIGLSGLLFGHKYKGIYGEAKEQPTVEEKILLAEKADQLSDAYDYITAMSDELMESINKPKKSSTTYIHHICVRCGDIKK